MARRNAFEKEETVVKMMHLVHYPITPFSRSYLRPSKAAMLSHLCVFKAKGILRHELIKPVKKQEQVRRQLERRL